MMHDDYSALLQCMMLMMYTREIFLISIYFQPGNKIIIIVNIKINNVFMK